jgi:soluble lytic murein transglycosylase-like protein
VIKAESNFDPYAVSKAGAQGLMQLMPGTVAEMSIRDVFDPGQNIAGGGNTCSNC